MASAKRAQLVETALRLFMRNGYHATGIDTILAESGVAKMTLYNHFKSKEDLILETLKLQDRRWRDWFTADVERRATEPRERLLAVFDALGSWFDQVDFQGCAFLRACQEYPDLAAPARQVAERHQEALQAYVRGLAEDAGMGDPETLAAQICLLMAGAIVTAQSGGGSQAARHALGIAETLIEAAQPRESAPVAETWID